jgi:hypothetical protein
MIHHPSPFATAVMGQPFDGSDGDSLFMMKDNPLMTVMETVLS